MKIEGEKMSICFIVGHGKSAKGGYDSGAVYGNYHEYKIAKEIAKYAYEYYNATYTESAALMNYNGTLYLNERITEANKKRYDFIAEIHLNAGGGYGSEVYYSKGSSKGKAIAAGVSKKIALALGIKDRGAKTRVGTSGRDYFGIIRQTSAESILVECAFIDTSDLDKLKTAEGQKICGIATAQAVAAARGIKAKGAVTPATKPAPEPTTKVWYFNKCNAKHTSIVNALKSLGFNSSFSYRKQIAAANGIKAYIGTSKQNTTLLSLLKQGKLIKP